MATLRSHDVSRKSAGYSCLYPGASFKLPHSSPALAMEFLWSPSLCGERLTPVYMSWSSLRRHDKTLFDSHSPHQAGQGTKDLTLGL